MAGTWGELIRADIDPKGNIWVFHRCFNTEPAGYATCVGRTDPPILEFDPSGKLLTSFGSGMFAFPHGFTVDREGNIWASDANDAKQCWESRRRTQTAWCAGSKSLS